jgi:hypothetical protein
MEGVVRAPTIMAELVQTGQLAVSHPSPLLLNVIQRFPRLILMRQS